MLALGKKIDYALISLAYLAERKGQCVSAREIAGANNLPAPVLMQILKSLHNHGVLESTRGVKGGYRIAVNLDQLSLQTLSDMLHSTDLQSAEAVVRPSVRRHPTLEMMRRKLSQFLEDVRVSEVVCPGRRIDVPLHSLRVLEKVQLTRSIVSCPSP